MPELDARQPICEAAPPSREISPAPLRKRSRFRRLTPWIVLGCVIVSLPFLYNWWFRPGPVPQTPPLVALRDRLLGKWEGRNPKGLMEGIEFCSDGVFKIMWQGTAHVPGKYRILSEDEVEVIFNIFYWFKAKVVLLDDQLTVTMVQKGEVKTQTYKHVQEYSFNRPVPEPLQ